jgi:hypothetical protein
LSRDFRKNGNSKLVDWAIGRLVKNKKEYKGY